MRVGDTFLGLLQFGYDKRNKERELQGLRPIMKQELCVATKCSDYEERIDQR